MSNPLPGAALGLPNDLAFSHPNVLKQHLAALANLYSPKQTDERYTKVALRCLFSLDEDNVNFRSQSEFEDIDGVLVGLKHIEKVCCD